jgi:uncharacterized protein
MPSDKEQSSKPEHICENANEAGRLGHAHCLKKLIAEGVDLNAADRSGWTAAHEAAENGQVVCIDVLMAAKADLSLRDKRGRTPAFWATQNGNAQCLEKLAKGGYDVTSPGVINTPAVSLSTDGR